MISSQKTRDINGSMITAGLSSYNFKQHVASDIGVDQYYLQSANIQTHSYMDNIVHWTEENKMRLNGKKTKVMILNFTTRIYGQNELLEIIGETKLLGCVIISDLKFNKNTEYMVKIFELINFCQVMVCDPFLLCIII